MTNNETKFYIKIEDGMPVNHPMLHDNVLDAIMLAYPIHREGITEEYILSHGYAKFENLKLTPAQYIENPTNPAYRLDSDGVVRPDYEVKEFTQQEKVNNWVRKPRDYELAMSDWTQLPDSPLSAAKKAEWAEYRQKLRDMTTQYANIQSPSEIVPPTKPN